MNAKPKPKLIPAAAYEHAQLIARDLLDRLGELLDEMPRPDHANLSWKSVVGMNEFNHKLSELIASLDSVANQPAGVTECQRER